MFFLKGSCLLLCGRARGEKVQWFLMKNINQGVLPVGIATVSVCAFWACILWILGYWLVLLDFLTPFSTVSQLAYSHQPAFVQLHCADWISALRSHSAGILLDLPEQCILVKASISSFSFFWTVMHSDATTQDEEISLRKPVAAFAFWLRRKGDKTLNSLIHWTRDLTLFFPSS